MGLTDALDVTVQIASALAVAHAGGIVHRDIKPENVIVRPDQLVKVVDFGVAKLTEALGGSNAGPDWTVSGLNTHLGVALGTPRYMSPEQVRGRLADGRSDIFSLGVQLYEMIAHRPPFQGDTTVDLFAAILERDPPPLATTGAEDVPPELERIVRKCIAKDPERRYRVASDLIIDLKDLISDGRRKLPAASAAASIAVLPFVNISSEAENDYFCDGLAEELINGLTKIDQLRVAALHISKRAAAEIRTTSPRRPSPPRAFGGLGPAVPEYECGRSDSP
jgi:serine/threonine protein kinase